MVLKIDKWIDQRLTDKKQSLVVDGEISNCKSVIVHHIGLLITQQLTFHCHLMCCLDYYLVKSCCTKSTVYVCRLIAK